MSVDVVDSVVEDVDEDVEDDVVVEVVEVEDVMVEDVVAGESSRLTQPEHEMTIKIRPNAFSSFCI